MGMVNEMMKIINQEDMDGGAEYEELRRMPGMRRMEKEQNIERRIVDRE